MNDFTKEELILLACWSANRFDQIGVEEAKDEGTLVLSHKIQSMIDNYCEMKLPLMANYCCQKCNEEWHNCECKK